MYMRKLFLLIFCLLLISGCGGGRTVKRISPDEVTDLSGRWNDTDSRLVAESMISDMLSRPWLIDFEQEKFEKPVVIVGTIRNESTEHINVGVFIKDIERELINSGKVDFVASKGEREEIREERMDQQMYASIETAKKLAQEVGADYFLIGSVASVEDWFEGKKAVFYTINLELIDVEKNTKAWIGNKKIKKFIEQRGYKW
ncbi:penicillin-binding protein activator LpoB [candidate division WOR-3 bacterium]|nr:penicillin-binding protein activator LpoB [candidate division WOR-3 bacterium]